MAGLLDRFFGGPDQTQALGLLGAAMASGQGFGQGSLLAQQHLSDAPLRRQKALLAEMQIQNMQSEIEARKAAAEQARKKQEFINSFLNPQPVYQGGQLGSGTMGVLPNANPTAPPQQRGGLAQATPEMIAAAKMYGIDLTDVWKTAKEGFEEKPGTFRVMPDGTRRFVPNVETGRTFENGRVGLLPGSIETTMQQNFAAELPKAVLSSAGRINLRPNADGTQSPVPEISENPILQNFMGQFGGQPRPQAPTVPSAPAVPVQPPANRPMVSPTAQRTADAESVLMMRSELKNPNLPPAHRQAIEREIARIEQASAGPGFPAPSSIRNPQGYGKTTAQTIAEEAERTRQVEQAKADVVPAPDRAKNAQRQAGNLAKADSVIKEIRDAKSLVGWNTAGVLGTLSVLPATEARDLSAKLTAIKANLGFDELQKMREQSPTGGALGGVAIQELVALQSTVASLDQLQSPEQLGKALDKIEMHYTKWRETVEQARSGQGGASGGWGIREKR